MSMKRVAGITALITAMAFVNNISDLTIVGKNNICYAKVVRKVTRNIVIQKKTQPDQATQDAQDTPIGRVVDIVYEPSKVEEKYDTPETEKVELKETEENAKLKDKNELSLITVPNKNTEFRLGDTTTPIDQYIKVNSSSGFKVGNDISTYSKYSEYLNNGQRTYIFTTKNFNNPITEPLTINGNLIIEAAMYITLQSNNYELTVNGNLIITDNGSIRCCMEKANDTGTNTIRVEGNIVFDGQTHKMSLTEQSYGFSMPLNYARSTQSLRFSSSGIWYAVNGKIDDYYNVKDVANKQTKYITDVKKPDVSSVFDKKGNGDVNGDGMVNDADVDLLKKYLINVVGDKDINKSNADVNGDGKVTLTDLSQLKTKIDDNKVKSPLIELTDEEINAKYAQYKMYLKSPRTYYVQDNDLSKLSKEGELRIPGNLILDKQLKYSSSNYIIVEGSLVFLGKGGANNIGCVYGTLYYNPDKVEIGTGYSGPALDLDAYGDIYIMNNPYKKLSDRPKYGSEKIEIRRNDAGTYILSFAPNTYMDLTDLCYINTTIVPNNISRPVTSGSFDFNDTNLTTSYCDNESLFKDNDLNYFYIKYKNFPIYGWCQGVKFDSVKNKYKGRIKALVALLLNGSNKLDKLPFLKIERNNKLKKATIYDINGNVHFFVMIDENNNGSYTGIFSHHGTEYGFDVIKSNRYDSFNKEFTKTLNSASDNLGKRSGYQAIIKSIFESGFDYYLDTAGSYSRFICRPIIKINNYGEKYYSYPIIDCLNSIGEYNDFIFRKGERPYDYGIAIYEPKTAIESDLDDKKTDCYKKIAYIFKDNKDLYKPESTEKTLNNLKNYTSLTDKVVLHNEVYKAFLLPIAESISKADIKKYDSKVGTKFTLEICKMIANGIKSLPKQIVKVNRDTYEIEYDINLALYGLGTSSATIKKNGAYYTQILFTNVGTQDGVKALCDYASALGILSKDTVENAAFELITYGLKDILHYSGALELKNIKQFGQGLTDAILSDYFAKQFAVNAGGKVKEYILEKGESMAKTQLIGLIENYIPNGKIIVETAKKINELENKKIEYEKYLKVYHESHDIVKKIEAEYWLASEAISKLLSTM